MIQRILAILHARNLEFLRDKATLGWNVAMPLLLVAGMAAIFSGGDRAEYKVAVVQAEQQIDRPPTRSWKRGTSTSSRWRRKRRSSRSPITSSTWRLT